MYRSLVKPSAIVPFPAFLGERIYMEKFHKQEGLPEHLRHWQPTVDAMLTEVDTDNPIYLMVDQGLVQAGSSHRRPGKHIDGYWHSEIRAHSGRNDERGGHRSEPSDKTRGHGPEPEPREHRPDPGKYLSESDPQSAWRKAALKHPEAIILASDVQGCKAYLGDWSYPMGLGGDCDGLDTSHMQELLMEPNRAYIGNVGMVHESIPQSRNIRRTLVRLNVAGWEPF